MREHLILITVVLLFVFTGALSPVFGQWEMHQISTNSNPIPSIYVGDIDGDDLLDVVASHNVTGDVLWYKNKNAGLSWEEYTIDDNLQGAWLVGIVDIDGDDTMDVVSAGRDANDVVWYENNGGTPINWTKHFIDANFMGARDFAVADIDGDDTLDVIASSWDLDDVVWYENNHPNWTKHVIEGNLDGANYIYAADLDGDGDPDVIVTGWRADRIVWYENNLPNWTRHDLDADINGPVWINVADLDDDGDPDVVATGESEHDVVWYENDQLNWNKHIIDGNLGNALGSAIGDIDGNDTLDVIAAGLSAHKVVWYKNNLPSDSWTPQTIGYMDYAEVVNVGDIDRDNDLDVVVASFGYYAGADVGDVVWYENLLGVAMAKSVQNHPKFIPQEGENLVINAHLYNPENHPTTVESFISNQSQTFTDSLQLYDDGLHDDSLASDNIWGNSKWLSGLPEDMYTIEIHSTDIVEDYTYHLPPTRSFTTIGPITLNSYQIISSDTIPNHGDRIGYKLTLRNEGQTVTATNITTNLISLDTCATISGFPDRTYGDIAPGATALQSGSHAIIFSDTLTGCSNPMTTQILVEISSDGQVFWYDTFEIFVTDIEESKLKLPKTFALEQNYPNPFNPRTIINYELPITNDVELSIYNLLGQKVATLVSEKQKTGYHQIEWDASNFSSGVYYYRIEAGEFQDVKKMILLR